MIVMFTVPLKVITKGCPNKQIQPKTWSKFFLIVVLAMGRLVKVDGLVPNKFYIFEVLLPFWYLLHKMEQVCKVRIEFVKPMEFL